MDINQLIWIVPGFFGVITAFLLIYWVWLVAAPGPRPRAASAPPAPAPVPQPVMMPVESDDTIIDNPVQTVTTASMVVEAGLPPGVIDFPSSEFRIGRFRDDSQNVLVALDEKSISRSHALLRGNPQTGEYFLQDIGSRFGTFIVTPQGAEQLRQGETRPVYNGTVVQFGSTVRVRLNLPSGGSSFSVPDDFDPGMTRL